MRPTADLKDTFLHREFSGTVHAVGEVYNDIKGRYRDCTTIITSPVIKVDKEAGIVVTRNSYYRVGEPS